MILHHSGREQVEESLSSVKGQSRVVVAAAQRECGTGFEIDSCLYRRDVMPSEAGAVVGAQLSLVRVEIRNRFHLSVENTLDIEGDGRLGMDLHRDAAGKVGGNVESALLGEQPFVFVELLHVGTALVRCTNAQILTDGSQPSHTEPCAIGGVVTAIGDVARRTGSDRVVEVLQTTSGESLPPHIQRGTEGIVRVRLERHRRGYEQLLKIDSRSGAT
jgi:hypothetical protein